MTPSSLSIRASRRILLSLRGGVLSLGLLVAGSASPPAARADCADYGDGSLYTSGFATPNAAVDVAAAGSYIYFLDTISGLFVVDPASPSGPAIVGHLEIIGYMDAIDVVGSLAVLSDQAYLRVVDVANPTAPVVLSTMSNQWTRGLAARGSLVCVSRDVQPNEGELQVLDISVPTSPQVIGVLTGLGWGVGAVAVEEDLACVVVGGTVRVIDISDPATPQEVSSISLSAAGVELVGTTAYVASGSSGLQIVDLSDPSLPEVVGSVALPGFANEVAVDGNRAWVANTSEGLQEVDLTNPSAPVLIRQIPNIDRAEAVAISGALVCVAAHTAGLRWIDTRFPPPETPFLDLPIQEMSIAIVGTTALVGGYDPQSWGSQLLCVDVSEPTQPQVLGSISTWGYLDHLVAAGAYAYVGTNHAAAVRVADISDPAHPAFLGDASLIMYSSVIVSDLELSGSYVYLAGFDAGLIVVDVSNPSAPFAVSRLAMVTNARSVEVEGAYAYVLGSYYDLAVVNVANPAAPQLVSYIDTPGSSSGLLVDLGYAYLSGTLGVDVFDLSDPASPLLVGSLPGLGPVPRIVREGNFLYLANSSAVRVVDISDPTNPLYVGRTNYFQGYPDIATTYDNLFISDDAGLRVLPIQCRHSGVGEPPTAALRLVCGPNPTRVGGSIQVESGLAGALRLELFGVNGSRLRTLFAGDVPAGAHDFRWDGCDERGRPLASGSYLLRAFAWGQTQTQRVVLVR